VAAFGAWVRERSGKRRPRVILARDSRTSGPMFSRVAAGALQSEYVFCGAACLARFREEPAHFLVDGLARTSIRPSPSMNGQEWTCPMHPEVVRPGPGACPICGMALEARVPSPTSGDDSDLRDMTRRFRLAASLAVPLVLIAMIDMLPSRPLSSLLTSRGRAFLEMALASPIALWAARPFYDRAIASIRHRSLNMFTLIALGVAVAYSYSVVAALAPGLFPEGFRHHGEVPVYFEAAGVIVALILLGQVLELRARQRTGSEIRALVALTPRIARRVR
jgi:Cu+-exporting ATPase